MCALSVRFLSIALLSMVADVSAVQTDEYPWFSKVLPKGSYAYGGSTSANLVEVDGKPVLRYLGDPSAYSGYQLVAPTILDLRDRDALALEFRARSRLSGESLYIGLEDEPQGGDCHHTRLSLGQFIQLDTSWRTVRIPLREFPSLGDSWNTTTNTGSDGVVDWSRIRSLRISSDKVTGRSSQIQLDISPVRLVPIVQTSALAPVPQPSNSLLSQREQVKYAFFNGTLGHGMTHYVYGGRTTLDVLPRASTSRQDLLQVAFDDQEYSGVAIQSPRLLDLSLSHNQLALCLTLRGDSLPASFYVGFQDDESDGEFRSVVTRVRIQDYATVSGAWIQVVIPLRDFPDRGVWWNPESHSNIVGNVDWEHIRGLRIDVDRMANRRPGGDGMLRIAIAQAILQNLPDTAFDAKAYWATFNRKDPDVLLEDFSDQDRNQQWHPMHGGTGSFTHKFTKEDGGTILSLDYGTVEWGQVGVDLAGAGLRQDWSSWKTLQFRANGHRRYGRIGVLLVDSSWEAWAASVEVGADWRSVRIPFSEFRLYEYWQPDSAVHNRRIDLGQVRSFFVRSMDYNQSGRLDVDDFVLTNQDTTMAASSGHKASVRYNHLGYVTTAPKRALVVNHGADHFLLLDSNGHKAYEGPLVFNGVWDLSGDSVWLADFSAFTKPGKYRIWVEDSVVSAEFEIGGKEYRDELRLALRSYYLLRSGTDLPKRYAGVYARPLAHKDDHLQFHSSMQRSGFWNAHGGWYDAGDYGKYVVNAGVTVATLMLAYELYPQTLRSDDLGIPESGNHVPDILDEVRYELEWFLRMQDKDGGVFFKVSPTQWDGFIVPAKTIYPREVIGKSTTSTLNFAAAMAQAYRVYKSVDIMFAQKCLEASRRAYRWAVEHPAVPFPPYTEGSGAYDDTQYDDEFLWAESALWVATGENSYLGNLQARLDNLPATAEFNWQSTGNLGWITLALQKRNLSLQNRARQALEVQAMSLFDEIGQSAFRSITHSFYWGSNGSVLNRALTLAVVESWSGKKALREGVSEALDYINGRNAVGVPFITGTVSGSPRNPHNRISGGDTVDAPLPGMLVGGVNPDREDDPAKTSLGVRYPFAEPGKAYYDHQEAFASNENCISWNAPLVFVLGAVETWAQNP